MANSRKVLKGTDIAPTVKKNLSRVKDIWLCSPFVTRKGLGPILDDIKKSKDRIKLIVISRYDEIEWLSGVTQPEAFKDLFQLEDHYSDKPSKKVEIEIHLTDSLHTKAIVLGKSLAIVGSANLTRGGQQTNHELGIKVQGVAVETIRKQLQQYIEAGVQLSRGSLDAKIDDLRKSPRNKEIKALLDEAHKLKNRKWSQGLIEFTKPKGREINYFPHLREFLERLEKSDCTEKQLLAWLNKRSFDQNPKADQKRIYFLETLGLIEEVIENHKKKWKITSRGKGVLQASEPKLRFYQLLRNRWNDFQLLEQTILVVGKDGKAFTPAKCVEKIQKLQGETLADRWGLRLHWLESLGLVEEVSFRPKKYRMPESAYDYLSSEKG